MRIYLTVNCKYLKTFIGEIYPVIQKYINFIIFLYLFLCLIEEKVIILFNIYILNRDKLVTFTRNQEMEMVLSPYINRIITKSWNCLFTFNFQSKNCMRSY